MAKKFKLVYDQKGDLKGSYTGIPNANDQVLIEKAVLDGEKAPDPKPAGEKKITKNGKYDVSKFASADVKVEGVKPTGTLSIDRNGQYDVFDKANVDVNVPGATTKELFDVTANGTYDIAEYANVKVEVPNPSVGVLDIVANGEYDVSEKAGVNVNVPNPSAGVLSINANGEYDVTEKASVNVDVPNEIPDGYVKPEGSYRINHYDLPDYDDYATIDVTEYATVEVPRISDLCEGTKVVEYGQYSTFDVSGYSTVDVRLEGNPRIADDNISSGYYYADGSDYDGIYVESSSCFHEIGDPTFSIPKNSGKLFVYVDENAWYEEATWPNDQHAIDQSGEIENIWGIGVGEETAEFSVSGRSFKIVRTK